MPSSLTRTPILDVDAIRAQFPALHRTVHEGTPLVYLDNAATSQKPQVVLDRLAHYYAQENSNVHRGVHTMSQEATDAYEEAREVIREHLNAASTREVIFTRGTTEGINLVARSFAQPRLRPGDEILITAMEHHANIVPWQLVAEATGARLQVIPVDDRGVLDVDAFERLLTPRVKMLAVVHISNALGTVNPVRHLITQAQGLGIPVLVDGAQSVPHGPVDVQALGADFFCFSAHKALGPTGFGVLYGREALLETMPPWQGGGDMIERVTFERTTYNELPHRFEAGTPHIAGAVATATALQYLQEIGPAAVAAQEQDLLTYATGQLEEIEGVRLVGTAPDKASVLSFVLDGVHPYDVGVLLDHMGVAVRTGHHCTQPLMQRFGLPGTVRASFAFYNTREEADRLAASVRRAASMLT
ncbi:MAG: cysteine desulfurase [Bacteroidota bacterium]